MKKLLIALLLIMGALFTLPSNATNVKITGNGVRLRTAPSLSAPVYTKLNKGAILTYYSTSGDWYKVGYNGTILYVSRDFASLCNTSSSGRTSSSTSSGHSYVVVNAKNLLVRTGPSTNYPYLVWNSTGEHVHLNYGATLTYLGSCVNGFYKVKFDGKVCWVASQYCYLR